MKFSIFVSLSIMFICVFMMLSIVACRLQVREIDIICGLSGISRICNCD